MKLKRKRVIKTHPCQYCKLPIVLYRKYCNKKCYDADHNVVIICACCNKEKKLPKNRQSEIYCSIQCANSIIDRKLTREKSKKTLIKKYGTINPFEVKGYKNLKITRNGAKISKTYKNKSEVEKNEIKNKQSFSLKNKSKEEKEEINNKKRKTNLKLYGVESTLSKNSPFRLDAENENNKIHLKKVKDWLKENNLELIDNYKGVKNKEGEIIYYNFKHVPSNEVFEDHLACGRLPIYKDPSILKGSSITEREIQNFIKSITSNKIICNTRGLIKGFEIDIYLPENNIAIEFNGTKWHSELNGKNRLYHLYKTEECEKQNIQLIHIFEDEWIHKKEIVKSRLTNLVNNIRNKIYARNCIIKELNNKTKNEFLNKTHIQGTDKSKFKLGLFHNNELVSVMTFGKLRKITGNKHKEGEYELIRFSSKLYTNVIGGFSKLLSYFIKNYKPIKMISYADRRWSNGKLYEKTGFKFLYNTKPNYWYMKYYNHREHRYKYRKSELIKILKEYNPDISEWENMKNNKYDRIWDCGSKKYELIVS